MADNPEGRRAAQDAAFKAWRERPRDASREETDRLWEAMWQAADFSWAGLADAGWALGDKANEAQKLKRWRAPAGFPGSGRVHGERETPWTESTLQDYWRWSIELAPAKQRLLTDEELRRAGLLVEVDGVLWHVLHRSEMAATRLVPNQGAPLVSNLLRRLEEATGYAGAHAPDGRVQLAGARVQHLEKIWRGFGGADDPETRNPLHLIASLARFDQLNTSYLTLGDETWFNNTSFGDGAGFAGATFGDGARFAGATFGDGAEFGGASFGDNAEFSTAKFGDRTQFGGAKFGDRAQFIGTKFEGRARFSGAQFGNGVGFFKASFGDGADFAAARFGDRAQFGGTNFGDRARFIGARFGDRARFDAATFGDGAGFVMANFGGGADFEDARFGDRTQFGGASFGGRVVFWGAREERQPTFAGAVSFRSARFEGPAMFGNNSTRPGAHFTGQTRFRAAVFEDYADFSRCAWPGKAEDQHAAFEGARFRGVADFNTDRFTAFALFDGAVFERLIRLADPHRPDAHGWRARLARAARDLWRTVTFKGPHPDTPDGVFKDARKATAEAVDRDRIVLEPKDDDSERGAEARWRALAGGVRTLKLAMAAQSDHDREQRFYRYELKARLRQPSTPAWEKWLIAPLYGWSSDFGTSIVQPFASLLVLIFVSALIYCSLAPRAEVEAAPEPPAAASALVEAPAATPAPTAAPEPSQGEAAVGTAAPRGADGEPRPPNRAEAQTPDDTTAPDAAPAEDASEESAPVRERGSGFWPALDFALSNTFRPFGVWWGPSMPDIPPLPTAQPVCAADNLADAAGRAACREARLAAAPWRVRLAYHRGEAGWTGIKALATVQSFFSIVLLFLFALAVRRRFQIS